MRLNSKRTLILLTTVFLLLASFLYLRLNKNSSKKLNNSIFIYSSSVLRETSKKIILALSSRDLVQLSTYIYPGRGLFFSPYVYIHPKEDINYPLMQLKNAFSDKKIYTWGISDGSGLPIKMTFADYYAKFIYNGDFLKSQEVNLNKITQRGNMTNNIKQVFPNAFTVEYYLSATTKEGLDWKSLWLIFEKIDEKLYLIGIAHDQWTI